MVKTTETFVKKENEPEALEMLSVLAQMDGGTQEKMLDFIRIFQMGAEYGKKVATAQIQPA